MSKITIPYDVRTEDKLWRPRWYQQNFMASKAKNRLLILPRRGGKSETAHADFVKCAVTIKGTYWFVEPTFKNARENIWREFVTYHIPKEIIRKKNETELYIELTNGSKLYYKGADNPDSLRGATCTMIVWDEVREISPEAFAIADPIIRQTGGRQVFISTPHGKDHFYKMYLRGQNKKNWDTWKYNIYETKHMPAEEIAEAKIDNSESFFRQEYLCDFIEGGGAVFSKLHEVVTLPTGTNGIVKRPLPGRLYCMAADVAKHTDFTVLFVVDLHTWEVVAYERFNQLDWSIQMPKIEALSRMYNRCEIKLDRTGVGDVVCDSLRARGLFVTPVIFTSNKKEEMVNNLKVKIENKEIALPDWQQMIYEMEGFECTQLPSGRYQYKNGTMSQYDDCVDSLMLLFSGLSSKVPFFPRATFKEQTDEELGLV